MGYVRESVACTHLDWWAFAIRVGFSARGSRIVFDIALSLIWRGRSSYNEEMRGGDDARRIYITILFWHNIVKMFCLRGSIWKEFCKWGGGDGRVVNMCSVWFSAKSQTNSQCRSGVRFSLVIFLTVFKLTNPFGTACNLQPNWILPSVYKGDENKNLQFIAQRLAVPV